jgi:spermidine synthase
MRILLLTCFFFSGITSLLFEIVWTRWFTVLFGSTTTSASVVLAATFLGVAVGNRVFGRIADRSSNPALLYGKLELGVAAGVLFAYIVLSRFDSVYGALYQNLAGHQPLLLTAKLLFSMVVLFPATFFMGGSLPVVIRSLYRGGENFVPVSGFVYGLHTVGAVVGTLLAGFYLPVSIGMRGTALCGALTNTVIFFLMVILRGPYRRWINRVQHELTRLAPEPPQSTGGQRRFVVSVAFFSGFFTLAMQILWTRMFSLYYPNTIYNFASIVTFFLIGLAGGALIVSLVTRYVQRSGLILTLALIFAGFGVAISPALFFLWPETKQMGSAISWHGLDSIMNSLSAVGMTILPGVLPAGMVLPLTWRLYMSDDAAVGRDVGSLTCVNTIGVLLGSLAAGFLILPVVGSTIGIQMISVGYIVMGVVSALIFVEGKTWRIAIPASTFCLAAVLSLSGATLFSPLFLRPGSRLLFFKEGVSGNVAVIQRADATMLKLNNFITMGGTRSLLNDQLQAHLPLLLHDDPEAVAFIGVGTGITPGASVLHPKPRRIVAIEIMPEIVETLGYFADENRNFMHDPRVEIVADCGRSYLHRTDEKFDVVVADLFHPYNSGTAYLFTQEHFQRMRLKLNEGGIYFHWLPLYQLSDDDFYSILATFTSVFPHVTVWRGELSPHKHVMGLAGSAERDRKTSSINLAEKLKQLNDMTDVNNPLLSSVDAFYALCAGEFLVEADALQEVPLNLDDVPRLEFSAPLSLQYRQQFLGPPLIQFYEELLRHNESAPDGLFSNNTRLRTASELGLLIMQSRLLDADTQEKLDQAFELSASNDQLRELIKAFMNGSE